MAFNIPPCLLFWSYLFCRPISHPTLLPYQGLCSALNLLGCSILPYLCSGGWLSLECPLLAPFTCRKSTRLPWFTSLCRKHFQDSRLQGELVTPSFGFHCSSLWWTSLCTGQPPPSRQWFLRAQNVSHSSLLTFMPGTWLALKECVTLMNDVIILCSRCHILRG